MNRQLQELTHLAVEVQRRPPVDDLLRLVVECTATILEVEHASVRLLDPSQQFLLAAYRTGQSGVTPAMEFRRGEGLLGWIAEHGEPLCLVDPQNDSRFVARPGSRPIKSFAGAPLVAGQRCFGVLSADSERRELGTDELMILCLISAICAPQLEIARLSRLIHVDPLTGTLNRRGLDQLYPDEGNDRDAATITDPLTVILADIDHFKKVNDEHGHALGDEVLRKVARLLAQTVRGGDEVVRLGGEEFLMVLPDVGLKRALDVAERARQAVERSEIQVGDETIRVTISAGVAERQLGERRDDLVGRADEAMYAAKAAGRNRVMAAPTSA